MRILNLYYWKLTDIKEELNNIKKQGFDAIIISPIQPLINENSDCWWNFHFIKDYSIGNHIGNEKDLIDLCNCAKYMDIKIIIDVIIKNDNIHLSYPDAYIEKKILTEKSKIPCPVEFYKLIYLLDSCGISGITMYDDVDITGISIYKYEYGTASSNNNKISISACYDRNINGDIKYIESPLSYHNFNFGFTMFIPSYKVTERYMKLCEICSDTMYYARPYDDEWKSDNVKEANYSYMLQYSKKYVNCK